MQRYTKHCMWLKPIRVFHPQVMMHCGFRMFPDSSIAKSYQQGRTKVKYVLQFGIAPYIKDLAMLDVQGKPFAFKFDEATTSQVEKQYDGHVTYFSDKFQCIKLNTFTTSWTV